MKIKVLHIGNESLYAGLYCLICAVWMNEGNDQDEESISG